MLTITVLSELRPAVRHLFDGSQPITVGRDDTCELILNDRGVSRRHCRFTRNEYGWSVCDLGSTNGLTINGSHLAGASDGGTPTTVALKNGDVVTVGLAQLKLEIQSRSVDATEVLETVRKPIAMADRTEVLTPTDGPAHLSAAAASPFRHEHTFVAVPESPALVGKGLQPARVDNPSVGMDAEGRLQSLAGTHQSQRRLPCAFRNYSLQKCLGVGGMGEVFLAIARAASHEKFAIKFLQSHLVQSASDRQRFIREMEITRKLDHPALVRCVECGEEAGQLFIVMEYCNGGNLSELLSRVGAIAVHRAVRLMHRLIDGVAQAHQHGFVHRDLKPANVLLHREIDGKYFPKISDFGLAKDYLAAGESGVTVHGTVGGSWAYIPREQVVDFRFCAPQCDVWSLAAIFYECLTLKLPRPTAAGGDPLRAVLESKVVPIESILLDIPPALASFFSTALAVRPEKRYKDAVEMGAALQKVASSLGIQL